MTHRFFALRTLAFLLAMAAIAIAPPAQSTCFDLGSTATSAQAVPSPLPLGCGPAGWPMWHLLTPPHRAPAPHQGFRPGSAHPLPAILVRYRCTGWLLLPVVVDGISTMGYVIDQPEYPCR